MSNYYYVSKEGSGTGDDPERPEAYHRVTADGKQYNLHSRQGHYVVAADRSLSVYEELAADTHSDVERIDSDDVDIEDTPAPADTGRYESATSNSNAGQSGESSADSTDEDGQGE